MKKKEIIKEIIRFIVYACTAIGGYFGFTSCVVEQNRPKESASQVVSSTLPDKPIEVHADVKYKD